jgi:secreted PhoX family phosphatase
MEMSRRTLLKSSAAGLGVLGATAIQGFGLTFPAHALGAIARRGASDGFGPLEPDPAGILDLPQGFSYSIVTQAGRPLAGQPTGIVPGRPDGTASFEGPSGGVLLVNNHEQGTTATFPAVADADFVYDPGTTGGTTTILVDRHNNAILEYVSLAGTFNNCAGGATPWGTWLTCEETEQRASGAITRNHGYVFEVDPRDRDANRNPEPLTGLGRFAHEAAVVDPSRGHVYLTEDANAPNGLLYRFTPHQLPNGRHTLRGGGVLEAMSIPGVTDLSTFNSIGTELPVVWKPVPDPSALTKGSTRKQFTYVDLTNRAAPVTVTGEGGDITRSRKFEGQWWGNGRAFIVCSFARTTDSGDWSLGAHDGQVWSYDPGTSTLRLEVFLPLNPDPSGATADQPDGPDNITVNPWGGLFLAEDGEGTQHLVAVSEDGDPFIFARNRASISEFTGVNFSPDRQTLFANIQDEGYVFAITGPFAQFRRS